MRGIPQLSVVVPVYNGGGQLTRCIEALLASDFPDREIIIVDDNSSDGSAAAWRARGIEVIRLASRRGPAAARNCGASHARGQIILFVDADVVVRRDTLTSVAAFFRDHRNAAALFGSYDDEPAAENFVSQYKNLLHHFIHQRSSAEAGTFWAGCGAIRREAFEAVGGFDERKYSKPSIEDIELGYRLRRKKFTIILDRDLQVKHLKRWTLPTLVRTDIFDRALPWSQLIMEDGGMIRDLNLRMSDRISTALGGLAVALFILSYFHTVLLAGMLAALTAVFILNLRFFRFFKERRGVWFSVKAFVMLVLYYLYSGVVFTLVYCSHILKDAGRAARAAESGPTKDA
ncbi:MAG TPA: glycosyltransferase family 2 protein [Pyrinomonadaceae bacterium]|jgi:glycosyltransferase involved in cell wall biosynthesis|nr:glycosyltransferase family 2 protein [Pyrinomonadaceae bacterium]